MNRHAMLLFFVVICQFALVIPNATALEPIEQVDRKLFRAQAQRVEVLNRAVKDLLQLYRHGAVACDRVIKAQQDLVEAQLSTAKIPDERIALLEEQLKIATGLRDHVKVLFDNGGTFEADFHEAEAARLHVEITLLQEQRKKIAANNG